MTRIALFVGLMLILSLGIVLATDLPACAPIILAGNYTLSTDLTSVVGNCFNITTNNVSLDCQGHSITGQNANYGIYAVSQSNLTIRNCIIVNYSYGIYFWNSVNSSFINNTAHDNSASGFYFFNNANGNNIANNTAYNNVYGIRIYSSKNNLLTNNTVYKHSNTGIYLQVTSNNNNLTSNNAYNNSAIGIYLAGSNNSILMNNSAYNNQYGFQIYIGANNNTFINNSAYNNTQSGFYIYNSENNILTNNYVYGNLVHGIYLYTASTGNILTNNTVYLNLNSGIYADTSSNNVFIGNTVYNGSTGLTVFLNTNNTITNNVAYNNTLYGIWLYSANNSVITNNTAYSNQRGIYNLRSSNNLFTNNTAYGNIRYGFPIWTAVFSNYTDNTAYGNGWGEFWLYENSSNNIFTNNTILSGVGFNTSVDSVNTTIIFRNSYGMINWTNLTNANVYTNLSVGYNVFVQDNLMGLANNANLTNLNKSAKIIFYNLGYVSTPYLLKDGIRCDNNSALCNISYDNATYTVYANVSSFSNFTTNGTRFALPQVNPSPIIINNPANFSIVCLLADSGMVTINNSGVVNSYALINSSDNWSKTISIGGLNGSTVSYNFSCTFGTAQISTNIYTTTLSLPNMTLSISAPTTTETNSVFGVNYNISSGGYIFDATLLHLNISNNFTFLNDQDKILTTFNSSINGAWGLIAPNTTGTYNMSYTLYDAWGNSITSQTRTIIIRSDSTLELSSFVLILLSSVFAYLFIHSGSMLWGRVWLFFCFLMLVCSIFISFTLLDYEASSLTNLFLALFVSLLGASMVAFAYLGMLLFWLWYTWMRDILGYKR